MNVRQVFDQVSHTPGSSLRCCTGKVEGYPVLMSHVICGLHSFFKPNCGALGKACDVPDNCSLCSLAIVTAYENSSHHDPSSNNAMLGVHASASAIIQYGKIARKQGLVNVALDILSRIHTIPTVPIVDCFQKIRQQVKCYLQLAGVMGKNECMQVGSWRGVRVRAPGPSRGRKMRMFQTQP